MVTPIVLCLFARSRSYGGTWSDTLPKLTSAIYRYIGIISMIRNNASVPPYFMGVKVPAYFA
jgi:hypothetical protein